MPVTPKDLVHCWPALLVQAVFDQVLHPINMFLEEALHRMQPSSSLQKACGACGAWQQADAMMDTGSNNYDGAFHMAIYGYEKLLHKAARKHAWLHTRQWP